MAKLTKVLGAVETCPTCKSEMFCNETEYQGTKKLQWQNKEGKSHYLAATFIDGKKQFPCRDVVMTIPSKIDGFSNSPQPTTSKVIWEKPEKVSKDQKLLVDGLRQMRALAYDFTKEGHPELSENTNLFGTIVNANITHLIGMAQILATKENS